MAIVRPRIEKPVSPETPVTQFDVSSQALLRLLCWFAAEPIPVGVLQSRRANVIFDACAKKFARDCGLAVAVRPTLQMVVASLINASNLRTTADGDALLVDCDVRMGTRTIISPDQQRYWLRTAMMMIHASIPRDRMSVGSKPVMDALRPHFEALVTAGDVAGVQHPTTKLLLDFAW